MAIVVIDEGDAAGMRGSPFFMNKLRMNLLYMENMRGYDGCCADEI